MRVIAATLMLVASSALGAACRFDPTGGVGPGDDDVTTDAETGDGPGRDAAGTIDARGIDAPRGACPAGYDTAFNNSRYRFVASAQPWALAAADCNDDVILTTHLATFEVNGEMSFAIDAVAPGTTATPWVGALCTAQSCNDPAAWFWSTGVAVDSGLWASGQPDAGGNERVTRVDRNASTGRWELVNVPSTSTLPYICECDL
jgi:hypothetical protein